MSLDVSSIRKDFPILNRELRPGIPLVYLDSTATTQKPLAVLEAMDEYYRKHNANIHRGVHTLAEESTAIYELARQQVADFIHARSAREIIFTRNATESINLVAYSWGRANLMNGDVVILSEMEHHSNLVPWQQLAAERGIRLEFVPVTGEGLLDLDVYRAMLNGTLPGKVTGKVKLVALTAMSNVLGTINPVGEMISCRA